MSDGPADQPDTERELPPALEDVDPELRGLLEGYGYEGVPAPLGLHVALFVREQIERLREGDLEASQEIRGRLELETERFPDTSLWDRFRTHLVSHLFGTENMAEAYEVIWEIRAPHKALDAATQYFAIAPAGPHELSDRIMAEPDLERRFDLLRAWRDRLIEHGSYDSASEVSRYLYEQGAEADPLAGWIASQSREFPGHDWQDFGRQIYQEDIWGGLPVIERQQATIMHLRFHERIVDDPRHLRETVGSMVAWLTDRQAARPGVPFWDTIAVVAATQVVGIDLDLARQLASKIEAHNQQVLLAYYYVEEGHETEALNLLLEVTDYPLAARAIFDAPWRQLEGIGRQAIENVVYNEDCPLAQRIGFAAFIRDLCLDAHLLERALHFQEVVERLQQEREE